MNTPIIPIVEQAVVERMQAKVSFTALDISNALKTDRYPIKHSNVSPIVRDIYAAGAMDFYDYDRRLIDVVTDCGTKPTKTFLYLHDGTPGPRLYNAKPNGAGARPCDSSPRPDRLRPGNPHLNSDEAAEPPPPRLRQRRDGALAVPRALIIRLGWSVGATLALDAEPGALKLTPSPDGGSVRVWDELRLRLCQRKLRLGALTAGNVIFEIDGDGLKIAAQ